MSVSSCGYLVAPSRIEDVPYVDLQVIEGTAFLYPSKAVWLTPFDKETGSPDARCMGDFGELFASKNKSILCLQIWIHSPQCENWCVDGNNQNLENFPSYLPIEPFLGKKEGDQVEFSCPSQKKSFVLTCQQINLSRQGGNKPFEKMVENIFMKAYNYLNETFDQKGLEEEELECFNIADKIKQKYFPALFLDGEEVESHLQESINNHEFESIPLENSKVKAEKKSGCILL